MPNDLLETAQASARQSGGATPVLSATHISKHFEETSRAVSDRKDNPNSAPQTPLYP